MKTSMLPLGLLLVAQFSLAGAVNRVETTNRLIILPESKVRTASADRAAQVQTVLQAAKKAGVSATHWRRMSYQAEVVKLPKELPLSEAQALAQRIQQQPGIEWAVVDQRRYPVAVPNDPEFNAKYTVSEVGQSTVDEFGLIGHLWYLESVNNVGTDFKTLALNTNWLTAWNRTNGFSDRSYASTVAVIDTGIRPHSDIDTARVLPGYDFIADVDTANDSDGRDDNPADPGDWVSSSNATPSCPQENSSWHGTFVAGIVAASANNNNAIAGVNPQARILPLRALGRCGGFDSDIVDAARWAGGLTVSGVPANPHPAAVVNFSLGSNGGCTAPYQNAINELNAKGIVVTAAAGNDRENVANFTPGNCSNVIAVGSNSRAGALADYSNFGRLVSISSPGGGTTFQVISTSNTGTTVPASEGLARSRGTSYSAPQVAGAASMVKAINASYSAAQVKTTLELSATPFPQNTDCDVLHCGAGVLNVDNAILLAQQRLIADASVLQFSKGGANPASRTVTLTNTGSAAIPLGTVSIKSHGDADEDFALTSTCGTTLAAGASCALTLNFNPATSSAGGRYAWVEVPSNGAIARVALYGVQSGTVLSVSPSGGLQFVGTTGATSATQTVTFTNNTSQALTFSSAAIQQSSAFAISQLRCDGSIVDEIGDCLLSGGAKLEIGVTFNGSHNGSYTGVLSVQPEQGAAATANLSGQASGGVDAEEEASGGGCTVRSGQTDIGLMLLAAGALWWRRRASRS